MIRKLDLTHSQKETLHFLLDQHVPGVLVWAYGSRVKSTARPESDLDLVVFTDEAQRSAVFDLSEAFMESNLPFRVDLFVWDEVPEKFRKIIETEHLVIQNLH